MSCFKFLESFAGKRVSSSEDRLEETKRRKLAIKARKLVELMMVSGIPTASGFEERIRFSEIEIVDANAIDTGVLHNLPEGNYINGWDINVAGVRVTTTKGKLRHHKHAEFLLRIKRKGELEHFVARRYGDFSRLHKGLRLELPGRTLPAMPKKNKSDSTASGLVAAFGSSKGGDESDDSSASSTTSRLTGRSKVSQAPEANRASMSSLLSPNDNSRCYTHSFMRASANISFAIDRRKGGSSSSIRSGISKTITPRTSADGRLSPLPGLSKDEVCHPVRPLNAHH